MSAPLKGPATTRASTIRAVLSVCVKKDTLSMDLHTVEVSVWYTLPITTTHSLLHSLTHSLLHSLPQSFPQSLRH